MATRTNKFVFLTRDGIADPGQENALAELGKVLAGGETRLLLHLHGGLVNEKNGLATAARLSGNGADSWQLGSEWAQVYAIWRTGAIETIRTNWKELAHDDRLYHALVRKLIWFVAGKIGIPVTGALTRSASEAFGLDEAEVGRRLRGGGDRREPFRDVDAHLGMQAPEGQRAMVQTSGSDAELAAAFQDELGADPLFQAALADIDGAANEGVRGRAPLSAGDRARGRKAFKRLSKHVRRELRPPVPRDGERSLVGVGAFVLKHAFKIALRCFKRFRAERDHGLHATVVEEVCRELYGDLIGAKIWGMMVQDAADHFGSKGFGTSLIAALPKGQGLQFTVTAHSAGSIWASRLLLAMHAAGATAPVDLFLLAPAVRASLFAQTIGTAGGLIKRCRMFTMSDALEQRDAVLGHDLGYIYPSSLLYLVSGLFEENGSDGYPDAPILGMQRFGGASWLTPDEAKDAGAISTFFALPQNGIVHSPTPGTTMADEHGAFDSEPLTLQSVRTLF